jgi:hypothetical protein
MSNFYVYIYLDPRKPGPYKYGEYEFTHEPFYVGEGKGSRMYDHLKGKSNTYKSNKIQKILSLELQPIILKVFDNLVSKLQSRLVETFLIKIIGRKDLGKGPLLNQKYEEGVDQEVSNLTRIKIGIVSKGRKQSEQTIIKRVEKNKGKTRTPEQRNNISKALMGHVLTQETKKKIGEANKNSNKERLTGKTYEELYGNERAEKIKKQLSDSQKGRISWCKGKKLTDDHRKNISESRIKSGVCTKEKNGMYGRHHTIEAREKMSKIHKGKVISEETKKKSFETKLKNKSFGWKPVIQYDLQGNVIKEFSSIKEAVHITNIKQIGACCKGKQKTAGNYVWRYKNGGYLTPILNLQ